MPQIIIDGIATHYEVHGSGAPLLMFAPGGFNATIGNWSSLGVYARLRPVEHLSRRFRCILFDRREAGQSGGRLERIGWAHYVRQAVGLLDHLSIERTHLMGGCLGCSSALAFAVAHPDRVDRMVQFWPAGGPQYRLSTQLRFAQHLAFAKEHGLERVVKLAVESGKPFGTDPRGGPWASLIQRDAAFASGFASQDVQRYLTLVAGMSRCLFDRDTVPGAEPEDLMQLSIPALVIAGNDVAHAPSAARYVQECLIGSDYLEVIVDERTEALVRARLLEFLATGSPE